MRGFLTAAIFLASVIPKGSSIVCEVCKSYTESTCSGGLHLCRGGVTHCSTNTREIMAGSKHHLTVEKECLNPAIQPTCGKQIVIRGGNIFLHSILICCNADKCNQYTHQVYPGNGISNGFTCPTCYTDNSSDECTPMGSVPCSGSEDRCITLNRSGGSQPGYSVRACATKDACDYGVASFARHKGFVFYLRCSPAKKD
ncbi:phospholipase A2 inhibitor and Ly6/PLAUR domain-containing protein-like [Lissotriton helveticus]